MDYEIPKPDKDEENAITNDNDDKWSAYFNHMSNAVHKN